MVANGDHRDIGEIRNLHRKGVDVRANSPAYNKQESTAPARSSPAVSADSSSSPLTEHQAQVLKNVLGDQASGQAQDSKAKPQDGNGFMAQVRSYEQEHSCKRSEALAAVAENNPELHMAWLESQQQSAGPAPKAEAPDQKPEQHEFMTQAKRFSAAQNMPLSQAMGEIAKRDPALHQRFVQEVQ